jgi:hypothetical protein
VSPPPDAAPAQRVGEPAAAAIELAVGEAGGAVDDGELVGVDRRRAPQKDERRQRREIRRVLREVRRVVAVAR